MSDSCPVCGLRHNPWMTCRTARRLAADAAACPECGHQHTGPALAGICIGCPCPIRGQLPGTPQRPVDTLPLFADPARYAGGES